MADNLSVTPGAGADLATKDVGGVHFQRTIANYGTSGGREDVTKETGLPTTGSQVGSYSAVYTRTAAQINSGYSSMADVPIVGGVTGAVYVWCANALDQDLYVSFDGGTTRHAVFPANMISYVAVPNGTTALEVERRAAVNTGQADFGAVF